MTGSGRDSGTILYTVSLFGALCLLLLLHSASAVICTDRLDATKYIVDCVPISRTPIAGTVATGAWQYYQVDLYEYCQTVACPNGLRFNITVENCKGNGLLYVVSGNTKVPSLPSDYEWKSSNGPLNGFIENVSIGAVYRWYTIGVLGNTTASYQITFTADGLPSSDLVVNKQLVQSRSVTKATGKSDITIQWGKTVSKANLKLLYYVYQASNSGSSTSKSNSNSIMWTVCGVLSVGTLLNSNGTASVAVTDSSKYEYTINNLAKGSYFFNVVVKNPNGVVDVYTVLPVVTNTQAEQNPMASTTYIITIAILAGVFGMSFILIISFHVRTKLHELGSSRNEVLRQQREFAMEEEDGLVSGVPILSSSSNIETRSNPLSSETRDPDTIHVIDEDMTEGEAVEMKVLNQSPDSEQARLEILKLKTQEKEMTTFLKKSSYANPPSGSPTPGSSTAGSSKSLITKK